MPKYPNLELRLIANSIVAEDSVFEGSRCWLWIGNLKDDGYGRITLRRGGKHMKLKAHRVAYETFVGEIPAGHDIDHRCRMRACINPAHLRPLTIYENRSRKLAE